jgi:hypothetical protein
MRNAPSRSTVQPNTLPPSTTGPNALIVMRPD